MKSNVYHITNDPYYRNLREILFGVHDDSVTNIIYQEKYRYMKFKTYLGKNSENLNKNQINCLEKCLNLKELLLVVGIPGTKKLATLCMLLKLLISDNQRALICFESPKKVDKAIKNFLQMFPECKKKISRIFRSYVNGDSTIAELTFNSELNCTDINQNNTFLSQKQVIFTTYNHLQNTILTKKPFDYVITNQTEKILEPIFLESMFFAKKFIMFGSPYTKKCLPEAIMPEKCESLFYKLCTKFKDRVCILNYQIRMNLDVMSLHNVMAKVLGNLKEYNIELQNDTKNLEKIKEMRQLINFENKVFNKRFHDEIKWVKDILIYPKGVVFLDTNNFDTWRTEATDVTKFVDLVQDVYCKKRTYIDFSSNSDPNDSEQSPKNRLSNKNMTKKSLIQE